MVFQIDVMSVYDTPSEENSEPQYSIVVPESQPFCALTTVEILRSWEKTAFCHVFDFDWWVK